MDGRDLCDGTDVDRSGAEQAELLAGMMMMMMMMIKAIQFNILCKWFAVQVAATPLRGSRGAPRR